MARVLADIDADNGNHDVEILRHGVLLVVGAHGQLRSLAEQEHSRTIPLADIERQYLLYRTTQPLSPNIW